MYGKIRTISSFLLALIIMLPAVCSAARKDGELKFLSAEENPSYCKEILEKDTGDDVFNCYRFYESLLSEALIPDKKGNLEAYPLLLREKKTDKIAAGKARDDSDNQPDSILDADPGEIISRIKEKRLTRLESRSETVIDPQLTRQFQKTEFPLQVAEEGFLRSAYIKEVQILDCQNAAWQEVPLSSGIARELPGPFDVKQASGFGKATIESLSFSEENEAVSASFSGIDEDQFLTSSVLFDANAPSLQVSGAGVKVSACSGTDKYVLYNHITSSFTCEEGVITRYDRLTWFDAAKDMP